MKELQSLADLDAALGVRRGTFVLYKHSTQCGISDGALSEIEAFTAAHPEPTFYYLDLLAHRDVSNAIAQKLGVKHESPQAIVVRDGKVAAVLNHRAIRGAALRTAIENASVKP